MLDWIATGSGSPGGWLGEEPHNYLTARRERCGRTTWLKLYGVLNWRTAEQFREEMDEALLVPCRRVVVDLSEVAYVGGDILRALCDLHEQLALMGTELRMVVPEGSRCARSVALTGLDSIIPTFHDATHAWRHRHGHG
jgi:anti-anti-sigma factor